MTRLTWGFGAQALDYGSEPEIVPDPATGRRRGLPTGAPLPPPAALPRAALAHLRGGAAPEGAACGAGAGVTDASRITLGGGVVLGHLAMDYAFQPYDVLGGGTHRVGLRWTP